MIELVRVLRTKNVLATFENDPRKIMNVRALTAIFNVRSWKMAARATTNVFSSSRPEILLSFAYNMYEAKLSYEHEL